MTNTKVFIQRLQTILEWEFTSASLADRQKILETIAFWMNERDEGRQAMLDQLVPDGDAIEVVAKLATRESAAVAMDRQVIYLAIRKAENQVLEWAAKQVEAWNAGSDASTVGLPGLASKIRSIKVNL